MSGGRIAGTTYEVQGEGPSVLLVHGLGLNRRMWDWYVDAFAGAGYRAVTYDLLGHGESDKPAGAYRMEQFTDQIEELCAHLGLGPVAIAGFSLGGMINRAMALARPDRVKALAIVNSYHDRTEAQRQAVLERVAQAQTAGPGATVAAALERWFTADFAEAHPDVLQQVHDWVVANDPDVYPHVYRLMATCDADYVSCISGIACPTLIIASEEDPGNTPAMAHAMGSRIPGARVEVVPGLRHMGLAERPEHYFGLIEPFFARCFSA